MSNDISVVDDVPPYRCQIEYVDNKHCTEMLSWCSYLCDSIDALREPVVPLVNWKQHASDGGDVPQNCAIESNLLLFALNVALSENASNETPASGA